MSTIKTWETSQTKRKICEVWLTVHLKLENVWKFCSKKKWQAYSHLNYTTKAEAGKDS